MAIISRYLDLSECCEPDTDSHSHKPALPHGYYGRFTAIFTRCMAEGYSTKDARDYAEIELRGVPFHNQP